MATEGTPAVGRLAAWSVQERHLPDRGSLQEQLAFLVRFAILAPSSHNTQPWRFRVRDGGIDLLADRTRRLPVADPADRELTISCGAALYHLCLAASHFGFTVDCRYLPDSHDPDLLASVELKQGPRIDCGEAAMFQAMLSRHTNRQSLASDSLAVVVKERLESVANAYGCRLRWCSSREADELTGIIAGATREQMRGRAYRAELASWLRSDFSSAGDGMPGYSVGERGIASLVAPWLVRTIDVGKSEALKARRLATNAPALAVLGTHDDEPKDWLAAGQALAALLLRARIHGIWASFFSSPLELPDSRREVAALTGIPSPQIVARFGYGPGVKPAPRRAAADVLIWEP